MTNKSWSFLKAGDIIDIIAPSYTVPSDDLIQYYKKTKEALSKIGLIARIPDDLISKNKDLFSANSLEYRIKHFIDSINNNESKAVWAIRGGYGAAKLIPYLEKTAEPKQCKLLLGFSDITSLHLFLENKWNWCSMHSPVINQILGNPLLLNELKPIILGTKSSIIYNQLTPLNEYAQKNSIIEASITGGNLSLVQNSLATSWQINAKDKIVFLEDVDEPSYCIDRMLNHLLQAGVFDFAKAVIFGKFTPPKNKDAESILYEKTIDNFSRNINIPVLSLPIIGHNIKNNSPLPLGAKCQLKLGKKIELICSTGGTK